MILLILYIAIAIQVHAVPSRRRRPTRTVSAARNSLAHTTSTFRLALPTARILGHSLLERPGRFTNSNRYALLQQYDSDDLASNNDVSSIDSSDHGDTGLARLAELRQTSWINGQQQTQDSSSAGSEVGSHGSISVYEGLAADSSSNQGSNNSLGSSDRSSVTESDLTDDELIALDSVLNRLNDIQRRINRLRTMDTDGTKIPEIKSELLAIKNVVQKDPNYRFVKRRQFRLDAAETALKAWISSIKPKTKSSTTFPATQAAG